MNNTEILDSSKAQLINELSASFSELANNIFVKAEKICKEDIRFNKLNETEQVDQIINTIFNNPEILDEEIFFIIKTSLYLKKINPEMITNEIFETGKRIQGHPFFAKNPLTTSLNISFHLNIKEDLNNLLQLICSILEKFGEKDLELSLAINKHIYYLNEFQFLSASKEISFLQEILKSNLDKLFKLQNKLLEIYRDCCQKLKIIEKSRLIRNENEEKTNVSDKFKNIEDELNEVFRKQTEIINKIQGIQIQPVNQLEELAKLMKQFSTYLVSYPIVRSFLVFASFNKISSAQVEKVNNIEKRLIGNFNLFFEESKKLFMKNIPDIIDRKDFLKKALEPVRNNLDNHSYETFSQFIDSLI